MVKDRIRDGKRIAELLSSEIHGRDDGPLSALAVADADRDVDSEAGGFAYGIDRVADGRTKNSGAEGERETAPEANRRIADVYVHADHVRVVITAGVEPALRRAADAGLTVDRDGDRSPAVLVEDGADAKRALRVFRVLVTDG
ncbi:MAG: hypothetical protein PPP58_03435 [Natronomonas sp.]